MIKLKKLLLLCFLLSTHQLTNLSTNVFADFKLIEVKPRIMTVGSLQLNDRIFFRFEPTFLPNLKLRIFGMDGAVVKEIYYDSNPLGLIVWNGKNNDDNYVLPGVYIYQLETGEKVVNGAVVVAR